MKKSYKWNLSACTSENGKYLGSISDNSVIMCDKLKKGRKLFQQKLFQPILIFFALFIN